MKPEPLPATNMLPLLLSRGGFQTSIAVNPEGFKNRRAGDLYASARAARVFYLDEDGGEELFQFAAENEESIRDLAEFAKAPFPDTYVQFQGRDEALGFGYMGVLIHENFVYGLVGTPESKNVTVLNVGFDLARMDFETLWNRRTDSVVPQNSVERTVWINVRQCLALFLLMFHNKGIVIEDRAASSAIVGGKRRAYARHSVIRLKLFEAPPLRRGTFTGSRGPNAAHEVRGTWVHRHLAPFCVHEWEPLTRDPDDGIQRYACVKCDGLRSWRRAHHRGDASKGFVTHHYEVTP